MELENDPSVFIGNGPPLKDSLPLYSLNQALDIRTIAVESTLAVSGSEFHG